MLADPPANPGVLRTLQSHLRHHRDAPCTILWLDPGLVGTRSDICIQRVRLVAVLCTGLPDDRRVAIDQGHHDVPATADGPITSGSDPGHDLQLDATRVH